MSQSNLPLYEWGVIISFIGLIFAFIIISLFSSEHRSIERKRCSSWVCIHVEGAVKNPGSYYFKRGVLLEEIFDKAGLEEDADLSILKFPKKFFASTSIFIPKKVFLNRTNYEFNNR